MDPVAVDVLKILAGVVGGSLIKPGWEFASKLLGFKLESKTIDADIAERDEQRKLDVVEFNYSSFREQICELKKDIKAIKIEARRVHDEYIAAKLECAVKTARIEFLQDKLGETEAECQPKN
jgi:hypothetical protein